MKIKDAVKDFLYGILYFDLYQDSLKEAKRRKDVVNLLLMGEMLGLPIFSAPVMLRLLPYLIPELKETKFRALREKDATDEVPEIGV